ncbi:MAG: hypothetical protein H6705_18815 [Myxococcales bacterium]|nr:hypothetical protein [Myxococcales bacterium]
MSDSLRTWSLKKDVATWYYTVTAPEDIDLRESSQRAPWLAGLVGRLLDALPPLAPAAEVVLSTHDLGEDAHVAHYDHSSDGIMSWVASHQDVYQIEVELTLAIIEQAADGAPETTHIEGGRILIRVELDPDTGELDEQELAKDDAIWMTFGLHTDAFCPRTFRVNPDNGWVARANGPALAAFLHRLEDRLGLRFDAVESLSFSEQVNRYGFGADSSPE